MTHSLERLLDVAATSDVIPYVLVEIPTNPRVEVPDMEHLEQVLRKRRVAPTEPMPFHQYSSSIKLSVPMCACSRRKSLGGRADLGVCQWFKVSRGGRCTAGFVTVIKGACVMDSIAKHLRICDNQATPHQIKILAEMMPSMSDHIAKAYVTTRQFVDHIRATLPNTKCVSLMMIWLEWALHHPCFHWTYPRWRYPRRREQAPTQLAYDQSHHLCHAKRCQALWSYGQLAKTYFTVPATSTQGPRRSPIRITLSESRCLLRWIWMLC